MPIVAIRQYSIIPNGENGVPHLNAQKWMREFGGHEFAEANDFNRVESRHSRFQDLAFPTFYVKQPSQKPYYQNLGHRILIPDDSHFVEDLEFDRLFDLIAESPKKRNSRFSAKKRTDNSSSKKSRKSNREKHR